MTEAEVDQALLELLGTEVHALLGKHDWDELIFGGYICLPCTPEGCDDPDDNVYWPCPPLREAGMTDELATEVVRIHYAAIQARAKAGYEKSLAEGAVAGD
jgi:hypothetical protein